MKKRWVLLLSLILVIGIFLYFSSQSATPQSFVIYYNLPTDELLEKMKEQETVIIEPVHYTKAQIEELTDAGVQVLGYINVMEADTWNSEKFNALEPDDFFLRDGERVYYEQWDSYLTDLSSDHYLQVLTEEIRREIAEKGLSGILFDTVGNIDNEFIGDPDTYAQQTEGLLTLYENVRTQYPSLYLVQNWGLDLYLNHTAPYVDGLMWEEFHYEKLTEDSWSAERLDLIDTAMQQNDDELFAVIFDDDRRSVRLAEERNFLHHTTSGSYLEWEQ